MSGKFWFQEESRQNKLLRLLKEKAEELGRLPTREEVAQDEQMPNPNDYAYYFGTFELALSRVATILGMKFDHRRTYLDVPDHSDLDKQFVARIEERVKAQSMAQHAKAQAIRDQIAQERLALSVQPMVSAKTLPKTTRALAKEDKSMEEKNYNMNPEVVEESLSVSSAEEARETTESVAERGEIESLSAETSGNNGAMQQMQPSGKGKGRRYTRAEIINLLRRAREENGGRIPSQAEFKAIDYLPSWATTTRVLGSFTGWPAILDGKEQESETGDVATSSEKMQSSGRARVAHRSEAEVVEMLQRSREMGSAVAAPDDAESPELTEELPELAESPSRAMKVTLEFLDGKVYVEATKNVKVELRTDDGEHFFSVTEMVRWRQITRIYKIPGRESGDFCCRM